MTERFKIHVGDCLDTLKTLPDCSIDACVTDPPYGIRFMGAAWDGADIEARTAARRANESHSPGAGPNGGHKSIAAEAGKYDLTPSGMRAFQEFSRDWATEVLRVLKPGGYLLSFSSARTYHQMACGIEAAGFEIRDQIMWIFGSGFPKSLDVSKAIDKAAGAEREVVGKKTGRGAKPTTDLRGGKYGTACGSRIDASAITAPSTEDAQKWQGWGTALKPAHEPICVARKPLIGTVAANVMEHGTGALNIDGCRIPGSYETRDRAISGGSSMFGLGAGGGAFVPTDGRWPANLIHDGSDEVVAYFPREAGASAARFFYCPKTSSSDRHEGLEHPGQQFKMGSTLRDAENLNKQYEYSLIDSAPEWVSDKVREFLAK